jgi:hypothetical protein
VREGGSAENDCSVNQAVYPVYALLRSTPGKAAGWVVNFTNRKNAPLFHTNRDATEAIHLLPQSVPWRGTDSG